MNVLIVDADVPLAELVGTLVSGLASRARIRCYHTLAEARDSLGQVRPELVVCEWELPDGRGLDLVRDIRRQDSQVPILLVSTRVDRERVVAAARYHVQGFLPKPFSANVMQERLRGLLPESRPGDPVLSFESMLKEASATQAYLPVAMDAAAVLALVERADVLATGDLAREWRAQPALTARLLDVANSSAFRRSGEPCHSLTEAVRLLGVRMSLNHALALSLDISHKLSDRKLQALAQTHVARSEALAELASNIARKVGVDPVGCYTAGLLHRIGELAAISIAQQYIDSDGALDDEEVEAALKQWSGPLGNVLKVSWRLPLSLRNLIGAVYLLPRGTSDRDRVLMRAAWLLSNDMGESEECERLLARLGLDAASARAIV